MTTLTNPIAAEQAAAVLNQICTRDELESIIRHRGIGLYGRLRKAEMARVVAGDDPAEVLSCDQIRQKNYRNLRKELSEPTGSS